MIEKRTSLEVIAPSADEAIAQGLADLGLTEEAVQIEILDEGSRGLLGLGSRQARIRLTIKSDQEIGTEIRDKNSLAPSYGLVDREDELSATEQTFSTQEEELEEDDAEDDFETLLAFDEELRTEEDEKIVTEETMVRVARETVEELLENMKIRAAVSAQFGEPDDTRSKAPLLVDIHGDDLSILIGPKAETLNALQYIANLIIGKELGQSAPLIVDVEGFRARRAQQIRQLARSMAEQAVQTGRRQVLEPMPASERRLVHIALRQDLAVTTESIGEDPRRKVTIIPKIAKSLDPDWME